MFFPIRDHNPSSRIPFVTYALLAANILIFISYLGLFSDPRALGEFYQTWGLVPAKLSQGGGYHGLITSMFLHGGIWHLVGNMLFLWIFGDNLEDQMGHTPFLGFYLLGGIGAGLLQYITAPFTWVPMIGASGAVAAVLGGYLLLFPRARVDILLALVIYFRIFTVPAWVMLCLWFGMQIFNGVASFGSGDAGVAYWAHAGGFVVGLVVVYPLWVRRGGRAFWARLDGHPDHPEAKYRYVRTSVPRTGKRR
ncbi:MAG: rhomboid family intramembrane serine protease [Dinoroseobacter sp.]|nr:rhomboid family intramembrane serine protease [Dinoroseobacter sp.]